jgi:hypothetical protein
MPELLVILMLLTVIFVVLTVVAALWVAVAHLGWAALLYLIVFLGAGTLTALLILSANGTDAGAIVGGLGAAYFAVKGVAYMRAERSTRPGAPG